MQQQIDSSDRQIATIRQWILRANALWLTIGATAGLLMDVLGIFFAHGPQSRIVASAPHTGIGFIEAHGLALIVGMMLWRAAPLRSWPLAAAGDVLLGAANLIFWQVFIDADMLVVGYVTTSLHWFFAVLQLFAASSSATPDPEKASAEDRFPIKSGVAAALCHRTAPRRRGLYGISLNTA